MSDTREDQSPEAQAFVTWAREQIVPLSIPRHDEDYEDMRFLGDVVANKRIVTFGETAHYMHEWNRWRARLFRYLVEYHGFDTFVLESQLSGGPQRSRLRRRQGRRLGDGGRIDHERLERMGRAQRDDPLDARL